MIDQLLNAAFIGIWNSIESAPKDGRFFLVYSPIRGIDIYRYFRSKTDPKVGQFGNRQGYEIGGVTHWMPLPEAPK